MARGKIIGHEELVPRLARAGRRGSLTHAVLLAGPEGVGKTTVAIELAATLLNADSWPGGLNSHPDFWLEDGEVENISIERVRSGGRDAPTLQDFLSLRPYASELRVAVVARAERLTEPAANTLLKTIEEPPPGTHLLLCAAHPERLPATVISRCETVVVGPVAASVVAAWLVERLGVDPGRAALVARLAAGRPGRALRLATDEASLRTELDAIDIFLQTGGGGVRSALEAAARLAPGPGAQGRERALTTLNAWASFVRDAACFAVGAPELAAWTSYRAALEKWAEDLSPSTVVSILGRIAAASEALAAYAQPRLAFEALLVDIFGGAHSPPALEVAEPSSMETRSLSGGAANQARSRQPGRRPGPARAAGSARTTRAE